MDENIVIQQGTEPQYGSQDAPKKTTDDFINQLSDGSIIAVQTAYNKAISVVVMSHKRDAENRVISCVAKSRDGTIYDVPRKSIIWHKVNKKYPAWVYEKIKNGEGECYAKAVEAGSTDGADMGTSE